MRAAETYPEPEPHAGGFGEAAAAPLTSRQAATLRPMVALATATVAAADDGLGRAALERALRAVRDAFARAGAETLEAAAGAPSDLEALTVLTTASVDAADPIAAARARAPAALAALAREAGGLLSAEAVGERLGIKPDSVRAKAKRGQLLAVPVGDRLRFPACQFDGRRTVPGLDALLAATAAVTPDAWWALQLLTMRDGALADRTPIEAAAAGDLVAAVALIHGSLEQGAA